MKFIYNLERKYGKYSIPGLMMYIVAINMLIYLITLGTNDNIIIYKLLLNPELVMEGEIWRIFSFIFVPPDTNMFFILFALYIYYMIGNSLENEWGSFKFNVYYFSSIILTNLVAFFCYYFLESTYGIYIDPTYLNMSLFLAFATLYPNYEFLIFFIFPVKIKYLAYLDGMLLAYLLIASPFSEKLIVLAAIANYLVFFGKDLVSFVVKKGHNNIRRKQFVNSTMQAKEHVYKCTVCNITEKDTPNMVFRYCSKCDGEQAYCTAHLQNHEHIKYN